MVEVGIISLEVNGFLNLEKLNPDLSGIKMFMRFGSQIFNCYKEINLFQ